MRGQSLIIGAGPAGCAAAITLARSGEAPVLVERTAGPTDRVCGDFLGADTIARACDLGVDVAGLGAVPVSRVRLVHGVREAEAPLPFSALSLSRLAFDQALRLAAERAGATLLSGVAVRRLVPAPTGWTLTLPDKRQMTAETVFLATGKHDLRDCPRPRAPGVAVGLKQYLRLTDHARRLLGDATELTLFPGGYAGFQPVEADRTGLCIAVRHLDFQALGGTWDRLIESIRRGSPRFAALLAGSRPALPRPLAVAGVPYGFLHRPDAHQAGAHSPGADRLFRLGDQAAVIPSLTGHGLAIALHSGRAAAEAWLAGRDARTFHAALRQALARQMRLSGALHAAFLSPSLQPWVLRAARLPGLVRHTARLTRIHAG